jgi:23S rRNA pseudouridine2605 synthase
MLDALGFPVLRLVRVAIGGLALGDLAKGHWRRLTEADIVALQLPETGSGA